MRTSMNPIIYADFQNLDEEGRIRLNTVGTVEDLNRLSIELSDGLNLVLYTDDADEAGNVDDLLVNAKAMYSRDEKSWFAVADWTSLRHASNETSKAWTNGTPGKSISASESI